MYQIPYYPEYAFYYNYTPDYMAYWDLNSQRTQLFGAGYMLFTGITFLLYARILTIIYFNTEINQLSSYQFIKHLGYADCIQLIFLFLEGLFCVTIDTFNHWIVKITLAMVFYGLICSATFTVALTFDRFVNIIYTSHASRFFSKRMIRVIIVVCWLSGAPVLIVTLIPNLILDTLQPYWLTDFDLQAKGIVYYDVVFGKVLYVLFSLVLSSLLYATIIVSIVRKRGNISSTEIRLTLQTGVACGLTMGAAIWLQRRATYSAVDISVSMNAIVQFLWIVIASVNPYIYLIFNKTLQSKFVPAFISNRWKRNKVIPIRTTINVTRL